MRKCLAWIICVCCLTGFTGPVKAQTAAENELPVISFLNSLAQQHQVTFSYSVRLLQGLKVPAIENTSSLEATLTHLSEQLPIIFRQANAGNYAIQPQRLPLKFQVSDAQDGAPIELVYVTVNNDRQVYLIPENGEYTLNNSFPSDSLQIRTSFYTPIATTADQVRRNGGQVYLGQDTVNLGEITVMSYLTSGVNSFLGDHHLEIDMGDLGLIAGETDGDVFQVLQAIPGIRSPNGKPGSLNFRGSPFGQNLTLFDNIPIYHTGHFFGTISPYNPGVVDRISVYRGTLPAHYGGRVGGLIDVHTSDQVPDSTKTEVLINSVYGGVKLETAVGPKIGFSLSYRTNYPIEYLSPKLQAYSDLNFQGSQISEIKLENPGTNLEELNIRFSDLNTRLILDLSKKHKVTASYLRIRNNLDYTLDIPRDRQNQIHKNQLDNDGVNLTWRGLWSENFNTSISYTNSSFSIFEDREDLEDGGDNDRIISENTIDDSRFNVQFNFDLNTRSKIRTGYEFKRQEVRFEEQQSGPNAGTDNLRSGNGSIHSIYGTWEQQFGNKVILNAGLRLDNFNETNQSFLDPRLSLTYLATKSFFLKASGGWAHQYIRQSFGNDFDDFRVGNQFWVLVNRDEQVVAGNQLMLGALYEKSGWLFDIEIYRNEISNINRPGGIGRNQKPGDQLGDLRTFGADFLVKKRWPQFETWLSYTLGNTRERFNNAIDFRAAYYDQRHVLNVKWLYPRDRWSLALSWNLMTGLPVRLPEPDEVENPNGPDILNVDYRGRFPIQHQMDLSATYRFTKANAGWRGVIGFSVLNLYNEDNVINLFQQNVTTNDAVRFGLGFAPNLQIKLTF